MGNVEIVSLLMMRGAALNAKDVDGWTPLQLAIDDGNIGICRRVVWRHPWRLAD